MYYLDEPNTNTKDRFLVDVSKNTGKIRLTGTSFHPSGGHFTVRDQYNNLTRFNVQTQHSHLKLNTPTQITLSPQETLDISTLDVYGQIVTIEKSNTNLSLHRLPNTQDTQGYNIEHFRITPHYSGTTVIRFTDKNANQQSLYITIT